MTILDKKIWSPRFLKCAERHVFRLSKNIVFEGVFDFFLTKEQPILTALKQMILNEIRQSNGIKSQKINSFRIFCKFLSHKGYFCWKVPSKVIFTFYLKHQNIPSAHHSELLLPEDEQKPKLLSSLPPNCKTTPPKNSYILMKIRTFTWNIHYSFEWSWLQGWRTHKSSVKSWWRLPKGGCWELYQ